MLANYVDMFWLPTVRLNRWSILLEQYTEMDWDHKFGRSMWINLILRKCSSFTAQLKEFPIWVYNFVTFDDFLFTIVHVLVNIDSKVGSIGFIPAYFRWLYPITLVKCDETTGEPIRNKDGFCIRCEVDEPGLVIGPINPKKELLNFKGYIDKQATNQKILKNVFSKNDIYFNSGDVLVGDEFGYYFFRDRLGDTFRLVAYFWFWSCFILSLFLDGRVKMCQRLKLKQLLVILSNWTML